MFWSVARYELKYRMTRVSTHVYAGVFFALAFLLALTSVGAFESISASANLLGNSPQAVAGLLAGVGMFGVIVTANFMGHALVKDFENRMHPLLFTTPLSKGAYLGGRYTGALLAALYVFAVMIPGAALAYVSPWADADLVGPMRLGAFAVPFLAIVVPNTLATGALFFALAASTRQMLPNYVGGVLMLLGYLLAGILVGDVENLRLAALVDPFGLYALDADTRYWTTAEKNTLMVPLGGLMLINRLIWLAVGAVALGWTAVRFRLSQDVRQRRARAQAPAADAAERPVIAALALPHVRRQFGTRAALVQTGSLARREARAVVGNVYFYVLVVAALGFLAIALAIGDSVFGTPTLPVTAQVVQVVSGSFALFILVIIVFYSGELVWRERDLGADGLTDSLPTPVWVPFAAKVLALWATLAVLMVIMAVSGMAYQLASGFTDLEPGLYLTEYGTQFVDLAMVAVLALTIHTIVDQKYVGHFVLLLVLIGLPIGLDLLGYERLVYRLNSDPGVSYSDMNGYGHFLGPWLWLKLYWGAFAVLLALASTLLWRRGREQGVGQRLRLAQARVTRPVAVTAALAAVAFVTLGGFIVYNTDVVNDYRTSDERRGLAADYERQYKPYQGLPQPRITAVELDADLVPERRTADFRGVYTLVNKTDAPVPAVHVNFASALRLRQLELGRPATEALRDTVLGYAILELATPLAPGDSTTLAFDVAVETRGFENSTSPGVVVGNGTFVNSGLLPQIGYQPNGEIADPSERDKEGLPYRARIAARDDSSAYGNTDLANDADFVRFAATVTTSPDQTAIAPGTLTREWTTRAGRRAFRYEMDAPILNFYAVLSARYAVESDTWTASDGRAVAIQVFYHPAHGYNVRRMIEATQKTLSYAEKAFSPYQYDQLRIIEFPRYAAFAQSFPNTIPFSESIGFVADVGDEDDIDYPTYITAHEVAHQWWGHQVAGAAVQGSTFLVETMAQYTALMVMKQAYGEDQMSRFLGYELDQYLVGRATERQSEVPLVLVEGQQYIHYRKGSLSMYALQAMVGETKVNAALSRFVDRYAFQGPPYPTSADLVRELRAVTPDSLQYLIDDLFESITLYENRTVEATATPLGGDRWRVALTLDLGKVRADSLGAENAAPMNDWLDVTVFGEQDGRETTLKTERRRLRAGRQQVTLDVAGRPTRAGVDPMFLFPDRIRTDNTQRVTIDE